MSPSSYPLPGRRRHGSLWAHSTGVCLHLGLGKCAPIYPPLVGAAGAPLAFLAAQTWGLSSLLTPRSPIFPSLNFTQKKCSPPFRRSEPQEGPAGMSNRPRNWKIFPPQPSLEFVPLRKAAQIRNEMLGMVSRHRNKGDVVSCLRDRPGLGRGGCKPGSHSWFCPVWVALGLLPQFPLLHPMLS